MVSRAVIVDEVPLFRDGVIAALATAKKLKVVEEGASLADAVKLACAHKPDIVILGLSSITAETVSIVERVVANAPNANVVCLTPVGAESEIPKLLRAGARGCMSRMTRAPELIRCLEVVLSGTSYVSPSIVASVLRQPIAQVAVPKPERRASLTERESRILELVAEGRSNKDIAHELTLSEKTVKRYMTYIMQKIHVRNRLQAALYISNGGGREG